jgi:cytochrome c1
MANQAFSPEVQDAMRRRGMGEQPAALDQTTQGEQTPPVDPAQIPNQMPNKQFQGGEKTPLDSEAQITLKAMSDYLKVIGTIKQASAGALQLTQGGPAIQI